MNNDDPSLVRYDKVICCLAKKVFKIHRIVSLRRFTNLEELWNAIRARDTEHIEFILENGIQFDPNVSESESNTFELFGPNNQVMKYTCLHFAIICGVLDISLILLNHLANIGLRMEPFGYTALHLAVRYQHIDIIKVLIANKAPINAVSGSLIRSTGRCIRNSHSCALTYAVRMDSVNICKILIENGAKYNIGGILRSGERGAALYTAIRYGCIEVTKMFLDLGCMFDDFTLQNSIRYARNLQQVEVVDILLQDQYMRNNYECQYFLGKAENSAYHFGLLSPLIYLAAQATLPMCKVVMKYFPIETIDDSDHCFKQSALEVARCPEIISYLKSLKE